MRFSVIIPARNEEAHIADCVASIFGCDWERSDFEVIVVDHGSTDRTADLAESQGARVIRYGHDGSISALRNRGATEARGEVLAFLDADCTVSSDWFRQAARYLERNDVVSFGSPPVPPEPGTWVQQAWFLVRQRGAAAAETEWLESMNLFVRQEAFWIIGGFDELLVTCEDYDLSLRLRLLGKMVSDPRIVAVHHGEAASVGHFFRKEYWRGTSNLAGMLSHGFSARELPSVALPMVHALFALGALLSLAGCLLTGRGIPVRAALLAFVVWQAPLLLLSAWKNRSRLAPVRTLQLYLLFNVYFLARGGSLFPGQRGAGNG